MQAKEFKSGKCKIRLNRKNSRHTAAFSMMRASLLVLENGLDTLHPTEIAKSQTHKYEAGKKAYLLGRLAGRSALSLMMPQENLSTVFIGSGVFSFPIIEGASGGLSISITHCDDLGMALVYPQAHPLAIDLERIDAKRKNTFAEYVNTEEQLLIRKAGLPKTVGDVMAWTVKESLSKVLRTGMTLDFKLIQLASILRKENHYESTFTDFGQYKAISYPIGEYVCSIVMPKFTTPDLKEFEALLHSLA